jgi:sarcosine oxidase, subunit delta
MLLLPCPWCGLRSEDEFLNGGDATKKRPPDPALLTDEEWCDYLYVPANAKGWLLERWWHVAGCQRWFTLERNTVTHVVRAIATSQT